MRKKILRITETAAMLALLVALQAATKPAGQLVTGSAVNAVLAVTVLTAGLWSGAAVALLSPFAAFLLGVGPQIPLVVPAIAVGNLAYTMILGIMVKGEGRPLYKRGLAWLTASICKFMVLYLLVAQLLCKALPLPQPQAGALGAMFSWPQLVTALLGGAIALLLAPVLKKALKRAEGS